MFLKSFWKRKDMQKHAKLNENETILKQYLQKHKNCILDKRFQEKNLRSEKDQKFVNFPIFILKE